MTDIYGIIELKFTPPTEWDKPGEYKPWQLISSPMFHMDDGTVYKPKVGLRFDGGSVPEIAVPLAGCPMNPQGLAGYILHDDGYDSSRRGSDKYTREQIDGWMHELHLHTLMDKDRALLIYCAVREVSWKYWGDGQCDIPNYVLTDPEGFEWFRA